MRAIHLGTLTVIHSVLLFCGPLFGLPPATLAPAKAAAAKNTGNCFSKLGHAVSNERARFPKPKMDLAKVKKLLLEIRGLETLLRDPDPIMREEAAQETRTLRTQLQNLNPLYQADNFEIRLEEVKKDEDTPIGFGNDAVVKRLTQLCAINQWACTVSPAGKSTRTITITGNAYPQLRYEIGRIWVLPTSGYMDATVELSLTANSGSENSIVVGGEKLIRSLDPAGRIKNDYRVGGYRINPMSEVDLLKALEQADETELVEGQKPE